MDRFLCAENKEEELQIISFYPDLELFFFYWISATASWVGLVSLLNGISTIASYLMPKSYLIEQ